MAAARPQSAAAKSGLSAGRKLTRNANEEPRLRFGLVCSRIMHGDLARNASEVPRLRFGLVCSRIMHGDLARNASEEPRLRFGLVCSRIMHGDLARNASEVPRLRFGLVCSRIMHGDLARNASEEPRLRFGLVCSRIMHGDLARNASEVPRLRFGLVCSRIMHGDLARNASEVPRLRFGLVCSRIMHGDLARNASEVPRLRFGLVCSRIMHGDLARNASEVRTKGIAMALLEVRGLVKIYGRRRVVDGVDFHVDAGEVVGLLGPNGAGKTTSFKMATGFLTPNDGVVYFNGEDVTRLQMYKRARLGMGYLSQEQSIFRKLTTEQNILAILEILPIARTLGRKLTRQERLERTDLVLEKYGLTHVRKTNAARLSGGEKRRLEIARCLVCEPLLILLDEPFTGIDPITIADIRQIVRDLRDTGIGVLLTDHNVREALEDHRSQLPDQRREGADPRLAP